MIRKTDITKNLREIHILLYPLKYNKNISLLHNSFFILTKMFSG